MEPTHACYPGSFDPVTLGHLDLIRRASKLWRRVTVAVGRNAAKTPLFSEEERVALIAAEVADLANVEVRAFRGLAVDLCRAVGAGVLLRGLRTVADFESEVQMATANRALEPAVETVFIMPGERFAHVSSRLIREVALAGGDVSRFVTERVARALAARLPADGTAPR